MNGEVGSILPSAVILGVAGVVALYLTLARGWADDGAEDVRGAVRITLAAILFQAVHFAEELLTGFSQRFPALFGLGPMPLEFFVVFNVAWLALWGLCAWGLAARCRVALFPLWFLGIASVANGVAHPAFSVLTGGYFPGLVTSPAVGVLGGLLLWRLLRITVGVELAPRGA